jgi:serine/threonine protein kinase
MLEYCEGGDLAAVIKRCRREKRYIPEEVVWTLFAQLIQALNECHKSASHPMILHRDIKPVSARFNDRKTVCWKLTN